MTRAQAWPRRWTAAVLAALLPLFGALAVVASGAAPALAGEIFAEAHAVDAIAPSRVVPVRHAAPAPPQVDRVDPPPAVLDAGPPRRAELPALAPPAAPVDGGVNAAPAAVPDYRGPPPVSAP